MRTMIRPMLGTAAAVLLLAACGDGGTPPTVSNPTSSVSSSTPSSSTPSTSQTPSSSPTPAGIAASIVKGQCLADTTSYTEVACTTTHVYQVTDVIEDSRAKDDPTVREVIRQAACNASVTKFTGGAPVGLLTVPAAVKLLDDPLNASRIVCLVHLRTDGDVANLPINYTLEGKLAGAASFRYTFCVDKVAKGFKIVRCADAHAGQSVGGYLSDRYTGAYPGKAFLAAQRTKKCPALGQAFLGTKSRTDITVTGLFVSESAWKQGSRYGACFAKVKSGTVTKSLQGIGKKSLKSYR